jgi:hypothetical protein
MTGPMQYRSMAEATVVDVDGHECLARLMHSERDGTPIPDRHSTSWSRSTFDAGWQRRLPRFLLQHRPEAVVGKVVGAQSTRTAFELRAAFSPLDVNPDARRCWHFLSRGELDQFSFGFRDAKTVTSPVPAQRRQGIRHHISATMMELSAVTFGSLDTELAGIRSAFGYGYTDAPEVLDALDRLDAIQDRAEHAAGMRRLANGRPYDADAAFDFDDELHADAAIALARLDRHLIAQAARR